MDGKRRAKSFGLLLGIGPHAGVGFVSDLWEAALDLAPDGDFSGTFPDPGVLVAHAGGNPSGCVAEPARVVELLQRVGLVAVHPTLRVRGLDRYKGAWLKNRKPKSTPAGSERVPKRKTEIKTETEKSSLSRKRDGETDPRLHPLRKELERVYLEKKHTDYPFDWGYELKVLQKLLARKPANSDPALWVVALTAAWSRALDATHPDCRSLERFEADLPRYLAGNPAPARKVPIRTVNPGENLYPDNEDSYAKPA